MGSHQSTRAETTRWLTPRPVLDALGTFDLDPCGAPDWQTADHVYLLENGDDGLRDAWFGRVWLNPPYGAEAAIWLARLADHGSGTALIFARTETRMFFDTVWARASALLFLKGRLTFGMPDNQKPPGNGGAPSVLVAYGDHDANLLAMCSLPGAYIDLRKQAAA